MWFLLVGLALAHPVPPLTGAGTVPALRSPPTAATPSATTPWRPTGFFTTPACLFEEGGCREKPEPFTCFGGPPPGVSPTAWQLRDTAIETPGEPIPFDELPPAASTIAFEDLAPAAEPIPFEELPTAPSSIPELEANLPDP